jgi:mycothiol synthase
MGPHDDAPEGFAVRAASVDDAPAIARIMNEVTAAEIGLPWTTPEEVRDVLTSPGRDAVLPDLLLLGPDGAPVGHVTFDVVTEPLQIEQIVSVLPHLWGRGMSAWLLRVGEERARARADGAPGVLRVARFAGNEPARRLFEALGYAYVRTFWLMRIELGDDHLAPRVPEGIGIRTFELGRDEASTHAALAEGFAGHWGYHFPPFEEWRHDELEGQSSGFDPGLWFLATEGEEVVGAALCRARSPRSEDTAVVGDLAVRTPWRRRGIALGLLRTAFAEIRRRGIPRVELSVDAENPTGATRLYERAGMREALSWEFWDKPLEGG